MPYARKVDANHAEFARAFQACGVPYEDVHALPGALDFIVMTRTHKLIRLEVKANEREKLTEREQETFERFPGVCFRVWDVQQALDLIFDDDD